GSGCAPRSPVAVSFNKGCYPGQEIVARTHYLGKVKQRMVHAQVEAAAVAPGDKLYAEEFGGQASGMIVNAVPLAPGRYDVLAVAHTASVAQGSVHCLAPGGPLLSKADLPYTVS